MVHLSQFGCGWGKSGIASVLAKVLFVLDQEERIFILTPDRWLNT